VNYDRKGRSPFYPGQPVPYELFVGRAAEVERIRRATYQVAAGKPQAIFIAGEYGIGKSSLASFMLSAAELDPQLLGFHVLLGTAASLEDVAQATVRTVVESSGGARSTTDKIRNFLAAYVKEVSLVGVVKVNVEKLRKDAADISSGFLPFLRSIYEQGKDRCKGLMLILDEINGLASQGSFSRFLKDLVDSNAISRNPLPLLLVVCGTDERRQELIARHRPVERIFEIAMIDPMSESEVREFYERAFAQVQMRVEEDAMAELCRYSGGLPKLMHLLGEAAYWIVPNDVVDLRSAREAIRAAVEDVGRKFVHPRLHKIVRREEYREILRKLAHSGFDLAFKKEEIARGLDEKERGRFTELLQEMEKLDILSHDEQSGGEFVFRDRLIRLYLSMAATEPPPIQRSERGAGQVNSE
jgi:hypothetical protein